MVLKDVDFMSSLAKSDIFAILDSIIIPSMW